MKQFDALVNRRRSNKANSPVSREVGIVIKFDEASQGFLCTAEQRERLQHSNTKTQSVIGLLRCQNQ